MSSGSIDPPVLSLPFLRLHWSDRRIASMRNARRALKGPSKFVAILQSLVCDDFLHISFFSLPLTIRLHPDEFCVVYSLSLYIASYHSWNLRSAEYMICLWDPMIAQVVE